MNIFELFGTIAVNNSDANKAIEDTGGKAKNLGSVLGKGLATAAKFGAIAVSAAATAVGVLMKNSVEQYAEYEQLVGGVETLFKDSSAKVMAYANTAYKTAGMSANEYMDTVTSFSASLLQSLGGDTAAAADVADMAITDMSDNANKMGTDMTMIQNAYQGFAKQNYTMLDNLKLGYGGTQEEMQRLLDDAEKLSGVKYDMSNLNDVYNAIHVVQTEMGITGTTAIEASKTISGSIASAKAAYTNWITALGDDNADVEAKTEELFTAIETAAQNILPVVERVLSALAQSLQTKLPEYLASAVSFVVTHLPDILKLGLQLIGALLDGLGQGFASLYFAIAEWVNSKIVQPIKDKFSNFLNVGKNIITSIWDGMKAAWGNITSWFSNVWDSLFNRKATVSSDASGNVSMRPYRSGLDIVPYDDYPALLHQGEAVLTKAEADDWRNGGGGNSKGGLTIIQNIQAVASTPVQFASATEAYFEQARWTI